MNFVQQIYDFNKQAGLLDRGYDDFLEASFQIEEALEGFNSLEYLGKLLTKDEMSIESNPKELSRMIVNAALDRELSGYDDITDVDRLDKAIDAIVFAIGSIAKLGLSPAQITRAIDVVTEANLQKLSNIKVDSNGKLLKDSNFIGPEAQLQSILDERVSHV